MADTHSTPNTDKSTSKIILSGKWLRAAGFDTRQQVTVKVMKGCIVLVAHSENEQKLLDENKRVKERLAQIDQQLLKLKSTL
jgi:HSP20-like domain of unknown function (DUF1813).